MPISLLGLRLKDLPANEHSPFGSLWVEFGWIGFADQLEDSKKIMALYYFSHFHVQNLKDVQIVYGYSEVPNRRGDRNKRAGLEKSAKLLAYLLSKLINEQGGIFRLLHEKVRAVLKENLQNLSKHALLLGTSEYTKFCLSKIDSSLI